jgi:ribosome-associated heat shock protein Hsp15
VWAIRLYKTRSDATGACRGGHIEVNGTTAKPATAVSVGDRVTARVHGVRREVEVVHVIDKRVGAPVAATCYLDRTPAPTEQESIAVAGRDRGSGRPTKRDRRELDRWRARYRDR